MARPNNPAKIWLGKHLSEETKIKLSESHKGKHWSEEIKKKISKANSGTKHNYHTSTEFRGGKNHQQWKGGISFEPYSVDWTKTLRISIRERDKYTCQICGEKQGDRAFSIHHIDYDKKNCNTNNLITLCIKCHGKTQYNRNYWIDYFNKNRAGGCAGMKNG